MPGAPATRGDTTRTLTPSSAAGALLFSCSDLLRAVTGPGGAEPAQEPAFAAHLAAGPCASSSRLVPASPLSAPLFPPLLWAGFLPAGGVLSLGGVN